MTVPFLFLLCDELEFIELMTGVTFLCPNKKVTKEVGLRGKAALPRDTRSP